MGSGVKWTTGPEDKVCKYFGLGPLTSWPDVTAVSEAQVKMPSEMLAISELQFLKSEANGYPGGQDVLYCNPQGHAFDPERHGKKYNLLLCDGHVSAMNPWVLYNRTNSATLLNYDHEPHPELWD